MARVVPKAYVERVGDDHFGHFPIGCGPFRFATWEPGKQIVLTRFDDYYGNVAQLDSVIYDLPEAGHRDYATERFLKGRMSAVEVQGMHRPKVAAVPGVQIFSRQELSLAYLSLNVRKAPFDDARVRHAVMLTIDRDKLAALDPDGRHAPSGILPPGMPGFDPQVKLPQPDIAAARALLAQAGYTDANPMPKILHASGNGSASEKAVHAELRRQLALAGITVETVYLNWLDFGPRIRSNEFHCFTLAWVADIPDPDAFLTPLFHSDGSNNLCGYSNWEVDSLLNDARRIRAAAERWECYRRAERLIVADAPVAPLFHMVSTIALQPNVRGFALTPLGVGSFSLEQVWLAEPSAVPAAR
jgi:peptide/nickel transport system substrate-binding protein/oligopeptide transport system substrate-binding protein